MKEYPEVQQEGLISIENSELLRNGISKGYLGIQIAKDGRIWICIDGVAFLRFKPKVKEGNQK